MGNRGLLRPRARLSSLPVGGRRAGARRTLIPVLASRMPAPRQSPPSLAAMDPRAGRLTRALVRIGPWLRPVRWLLGGVAVYMALQLLPYALWEGPAPGWAVGGLLAGGAVWLALPAAVGLARRRAVIRPADLPPGPAADLLARSCAARLRFEAASTHLGERRDWTRDARGRLDQTTWSIAVRTREMARLQAMLADAPGGTDGPLRRAELERLRAELGRQEELARDLSDELVALADTAERAAVVATGVRAGTAPLPELSYDERAAVEAVRWFRLRLEALEQAWSDLGRD